MTKNLHYVTFKVIAWPNSHFLTTLNESVDPEQSIPIINWFANWLQDLPNG